MRLDKDETSTWLESQKWGLEIWHGLDCSQAWLTCILTRKNWLESKNIQVSSSGLVKSWKKLNNSARQGLHSHTFWILNYFLTDLRLVWRPDLTRLDLYLSWLMWDLPWTFFSIDRRLALIKLWDLTWTCPKWHKNGVQYNAIQLSFVISQTC